MRKGSKAMNSTHDHGGLLVAGPGQDWLHWEEWRQWQDQVEAAWAGNASAVLLRPVVGTYHSLKRRQREGTRAYPTGVNSRRL